MKPMRFRFFLLVLLFYVNSTVFASPIKVVRVIDGDTFEVENGERVRLIGINTPEISDVFGKEAKKFLVKMVEGKVVNLVTDGQSKDRDRYSRLLRYVVIDGLDVNKRMIAEGYAFAYLKYKFDRKEEYRQSQIKATNDGVGMWTGTNKGNAQQASANNVPKNYPTSKHYFIYASIIALLCVGFYYAFKR